MAMTKDEVTLLVASRITSFKVAEVAADLADWVDDQDTQATALLALLAVGHRSKSPARLKVLASERYAIIETDPPVITTITPNTRTAGGTQAVAIVGHDLTSTTGITVGGTAATSVVVVDDTHVTAVFPSKTAGTYDVVITTPAGSGTKTGGFIYT